MFCKAEMRSHLSLPLSLSLSVVSSEDKTASLKWLAQKRYRSIQQISISLFSCVWSDGWFHSDSFHVALKHLTHGPYSLIPVRRTRRFRSLISVRFIKMHIRLIRTHGCTKVVKVAPFSWNSTRACLLSANCRAVKIKVMRNMSRGLSGHGLTEN